MRTKVRTAVGAGLAGVMSLSLLPEPAQAAPVDDEHGFIFRLNQLRASRGVRTLAVNGHLTGMARNWSAQMASAGTISHNPNMTNQAPSNWSRLGENVGVGPDVDSLHNAFMASPSHYQNMVNPYYDSVGVGVVWKDGNIFVTVNFMTTRGSAGASPGSSPVSASPGRRASRVVCRKARRGRVVCRRVKARRVPARRARR